MDPTTLPLKDIHLPEPIGWWPPGVGWWLLAAVLIGTLFAATVYWIHWRRQRPLRQALAGFEEARAYLQAGRPNDALQLASQTLRRTAITISGHAVSGLTGDAWLSWLDGQWQRQGFVRGAGRLLSSAPYRSSGNINQEQAGDLIELARAWTRAQRVRSRQQ